MDTTKLYDRLFDLDEAIHGIKDAANALTRCQNPELTDMLGEILVDLCEDFNETLAAILSRDMDAAVKLATMITDYQHEGSLCG